MLGGFHFEKQDLYNEIKNYQERENKQKSVTLINPQMQDTIKNPTFKLPEKNLILNLGSYQAYPEVNNPYKQTEDPNRNKQWFRPYYNLREIQRASNPIALGMSRTPKGNVGPIFYY